MLKDREFNICGPMISAQHEASSKIYNRVISKKGTTWYYLEGPGAASNIYKISKNKNGMGGAKIKFQTKEGVFEETGVWNVSSEYLFRDTGIDLRNTHIYSYAISLQAESTGSYSPYKLKHVLVAEYNKIGNGKEAREKAKELSKKFNQKVFLIEKTAGGGSAGWIKNINKNK